ncbi:THAP domain-containing protein 11-like [Ixodes scapularis]
MICARKRHALQPLPAYFLSDLDLAQTVTLPASQEPAQPGSPLASAGAPDTDDVIASGTTSEVSLVVLREYKVYYITEVVRGKELVGKIYDVDFKCTNAQELYKEVCPDGCGMKPTRDF